MNTIEDLTIAKRVLEERIHRLGQKIDALQDDMTSIQVAIAAIEDEIAVCKAKERSNETKMGMAGRAWYNNLR